MNLLTDCHSDAEILPTEIYAYLPERGFTLREFAQADELLIHGKTILALAQHELSDDQQKKEAKLLLRNIIEYHLDGQPLRTRELFQQKKRFEQPG